MDYTTHGATLLSHHGYNATSVRAVADMLLSLCPAPDGLAFRIDLADGHCAWMAQNSTGGEKGWHCVAIAPMGELHDADSMPLYDLMNGPKWPATWRTAYRSGLSPQAQARKTLRDAKAALPFVIGGFAWARQPDGPYLLAKVVTVEPLAVQLSPKLPTIEARDTGLEWHVFDKAAAGCEAEWQSGREYHNYRLLCMMVGARVRNIALRAKKDAAKAAKKGSKAPVRRTAAEMGLKPADPSKRYDD